jgi:hypothetical protein
MRNLKNCFTIFAPINDGHQDRFLAGEVESSPAISNVEVRRIKTYLLSETKMKVDRTYENRGDGIMMGFIERKGSKIPIISEAAEVVVVAINNELVTVVETGNMGTARVVSSTGLKGVLKPMNDLGSCTISILGSQVNVPVHLIAGPNAVKTDKGTNTIQLAKAAAAIYYGLATDTIVDSQDEEQVNRLAALFPDCEYNGVMYPCGIVQIQATEIGADYAKLKPLVFSFVMLKYLYEDGYYELFDAILEEGRSEDDIKPILEMYRCMKGIKGDMKYMKASDLLKVMKATDLPTTMVDEFPNESWLFSEGNKGFLVKTGSYISRIPSGEILNKENSVMMGKFMYGNVPLAASRLLRELMEGRNLSYKSVNHPAAQYVAATKSVLFTGEKASENRASNMIKPSLLGINLKQVAEANLPRDVLAVPERIYKQMRRKTFGKEFPGAANQHDMYVLSCRNPALWRFQLRAFKVISIQECNDTYGSDMHPEAYMVAMNPQTMMEARSDCDGDLLPLFLLKTQSALTGLNGFKRLFVTNAEMSWIDDYTKGEMKEFVIGPYKLNHISWDSYRSKLLDANLTKQAVGSATNDSWSFQFLLEAYQAEYAVNKGRILHGDKSIKLRALDNHQAIELYSIFIFLLQDNVISGIKHSSGGSDTAKEFSLEAMDGSKKALLDNYKLEKELIHMFFYVLEWGRKRGYTSAVKKFLRLTNKGIFPKFEAGDEDRMNLFRGKSLLGILTQPLRDIDLEAEQQKTEAYVGASSSDSLL